MIVAMKKIYIVILDRDKEVAIEKLAELGILHIEQEYFSQQDERINNVQKEWELINAAIEKLEKRLEDSKIKTSEFNSQYWQKYALHIVDLDRRIFQLEEYKEKLSWEIDIYQDWKDFEPEEIQKLKEKEIYSKLYLIPKKEIKKISDEFVVQEIFSKGTLRGCLVIGYKKEPTLNFKEVSLPKLSISQMYKRKREVEEKIEQLKKELANYTQFKEEFLKIKYKLEDELLFFKTLSGMAKLDSFVYVSGYVPFDKVSALLELAKRNSWAILIKDPTPLDRVPTLLRNPKWLRIIEPVFKFLELLPGYNELDISFLFLIFFSLFFGIIIGDAGYGLIYLGITYFSHKKFFKRIKDKFIFPLFYLLSSTAILWGLLSGVFFGSNSLFRPIIPILRDNAFFQKFCLFLGVIHLGIAHLWQAILKFPSLEFISELGWVSIILGSFFVACNLVLGETWLPLIKWFYLSGIFLIIFFSYPSKNIFLSILKGFGNVFSNLVNTFTDLVSYIRLFAVGLATIAVSDAFNQLASQSGFNGFFQGLISSLILVSGHLLNILLGPMSVLVHGVRLNVLEFSNHLNLKWKGFAYQPFRLQYLRR